MTNPLGAEAVGLGRGQVCRSEGEVGKGGFRARKPWW